MLAILVPLLLLAAEQPAAEQPAAEPDAATQALIERNALEGAFVQFYAPYAAAPNAAPSWEFPSYSAETTALITRWRSVTPTDEVDALSDGDWLCQCQEWDSTSFTATIVSTEMAGKDQADLHVAVDLGLGNAAESVRTLQLMLKREEGVWKIDDIIADSFPGGLKQTLRDTIAAEGPPSGERG
jgi:hypothetical protein